tara:strand:+ start:1138 stop:2550 length:1413 start_codon:yes stop_codon:yes gene_type:complete
MIGEDARAQKQPGGQSDPFQRGAQPTPGTTLRGVGAPAAAPTVDYTSPEEVAKAAAKAAQQRENIKMGSGLGLGKRFEYEAAPVRETAYGTYEAAPVRPDPVTGYGTWGDYDDPEAPRTKPGPFLPTAIDQGDNIVGNEGETGTMEPTPGRDPAFDESLGDKDREYNIWEANAMNLLAEEEGIPPKILEEMISAQQHELEAKGQMEKAAHLAMLNQMGMGQTGGVGYGLGNIEAKTNIGQAKIATNIWYDNQLKIQEQRMHKLDLMMDQAKADRNVEAQKELLAMKIAAEKENDLLNLGFNAVDTIYAWVESKSWTQEQAEAYLAELSKLSKEGDVEAVLALLSEVTGKGADFKGSGGEEGEEGEEDPPPAIWEKWPTKKIRVDDPDVPYGEQVVDQKVYPQGGHPGYSDDKKKQMYENAGNSEWTNQPPDWPGPGDGTKREWSELTNDEKYKEWAAFAGVQYIKTTPLG